MNKEKKLKCECDDTGIVTPDREYQYSEEEKSGMNHAPNKCKGTNEIKKYKRNGKVLWLCSCCDMFSDVLIQS